MRRFAVVTTVSILSVLSAQHTLQAAEPNNASAQIKNQQNVSGGYCGIYCLYGAMRIFGVHVEPNELLKPEYISSPAGSSLAELKKCAEAHGLHAMSMARLTTKDLRDINLPVIIHVKFPPVGKKYNHYELFMGTRPFDSAHGRQALIYDPPKLEAVEFWTIAPRWDGAGLIVSDKPIQISRVFASSRWRFAGYAGIAAAIVLAVRWGGRRWKWLGKTTSNKQAILFSIGQCAVICLAAATSAFAYHFINDEGVLLRGTSTANIQQAYRATFIPKLTTAKTHRWLAEKAALFVDPRPDYIFKKNHLQDAINVPAYFTKDERATAMTGIDKNKQIVVYCDDSTRRLGEAVALRLSIDGFAGVVIYRGKWEQWTK
jgi:rhodanese-related sulfurtransferase